MILLNLRDLFQAKEERITSLECKLAALEEENINLQKRINELENKASVSSSVEANANSKITKPKEFENLPFAFTSKYKQPSSRGGDNKGNIFNTQKELNYIKSVQQKYLSGKYGSIISPIGSGPEI